MKPFYYWPLYAADILGIKPKNRNVWSFIRASVTIFFTASIGVGCLLEASWNWKGVVTLGKVFPSLTPVIQILAKCFVFILKYEKIQKSVENLNNFKSTRNHENVKIDAALVSLKKSTNKYLNLYASMIYLSGTVYNLWPYFVRSFPYVCYQLKIFQQDLFYNIAFLWQFFSGYVIMVNVAFAFDLFLLSQMAYIYLELRILKMEFKSLTHKHGYDVLLRRFGQLVRRHIKILEYIDDVNDLYSNMLLLQFLSSFLAICNGLFTFFLFKNYVEFFSFVGSYLTQLLIYCICGVIVIEQTNSVGDAVYKSKWWTDEPKIRKNVLFVIHRSQKSGKITVGNIYLLNLESFTSVIKTSYSFFALMQTMYEKK